MLNVKISNFKTTWFVGFVGNILNVKVYRSKVQVVKELSPIVTNSKYPCANQCRRPYIL